MNKTNLGSMGIDRTEQCAGSGAAVPFLFGQCINEGHINYKNELEADNEKLAEAIREWRKRDLEHLAERDSARQELEYVKGRLFAVYKEAGGILNAEEFAQREKDYHERFGKVELSFPAELQKVGERERRANLK